MQLAELNISRFLVPSDDPRVAEFMNNLDRVNGLGKRMPGFVWLMSGEDDTAAGNTENYVYGDPRFIANLTVWQDLGSLERFVFKTLHQKFMARRDEWFEILDQMHFVMWWVEDGHRPTLDEALARLEHLQANGASSHAFGWEFARANYADQQGPA